MSKIDDRTGKYTPGYIYELRCKIDEQWHPFYVGETISLSQRIGQHRVSAKYADETSTLVYRFIHDYLDANNIEWDMFEVDQYDDTGPEALEDEHIMRLLVEGVALKNTKKGNANWMTERMLVANDMRQRNITSYRKYKEVLTYEEHQRKVDAANAQRVAEQQALTKQEQIRQQMIEQAKAYAEQARIKLEKENAAKLARELQQRLAWEADAPARELRLRLETERLEQEELKQQQIRLAKEAELDARFAEHDERMKSVKAEEKKMLERAQQRMAKILEITKK